MPASVDGGLPEQRIVESAAQLPPGGAVTGWAALRWFGAAFFDGLASDGRTPRPVHAVLGPGHHRRPRPGTVFTQDRLDPAEVVTVRGLRCVSPRRALFDEMRLAADVREAVVAMDMAAAAELTSAARMATYVRGRRGWRGVTQVDAALHLASEHSRSPQETRARLVWVLDAGLPAPLVNPGVWTRAGRLIGYADLLDPVAGLVLEYDGDHHRAARRHSADVDREARFRRHLLEVTRATSADVRDADRLVRRLHEARGRALFLPGADRPWTLVPPEGWEPDLPLDLVLDVRGEPE